jgi:hypothetical protein
VTFFAQTRTELGWNGHGDVIYKALEPLLYQRDAAIIQPLVSCLITVLGKVECGYIRDEPNYQVTGKYVHVLTVVSNVNYQLTVQNGLQQSYS